MSAQLWEKNKAKVSLEGYGVRMGPPCHHFSHPSVSLPSNTSPPTTTPSLSLSGEKAEMILDSSCYPLGLFGS